MSHRCLRVALPGALAVILTACPTTTPDDDDSAPITPLTLTAVTFNTGTTESMGNDTSVDDGYEAEQAAISDAYYGDGLAWVPVVEDVTALLADVRPDVIGFQEIFYSEECAEIPADAVAGFVCETWRPGDPTVAQVVLGAGFQVACHPGKPDKCAAVRTELGTFQGCDADFCLEGLAGSEIDGCGSGARVGRGVVELADGGTLTLVDVHGSSGFGTDEMDCRTEQFRQVFEDLGLGDGEPAANGERNVILGDFNTDPGRATEADPSAAYLAEQVGEGTRFRFVTDVGEDAEPTYAGLVNIDHVISDAFDGACWHAGVSDGHPAVSEVVYLDHVPAVCALVGE